MKRDYDVIVVGAGDAGLAAAVTAHDGGARVLIIEAGAAVGGSSRLSGGVFYAAGTSVQRKAGVAGDTAEAMFHYYMTLNQYRAEPALVRQLAMHAGPTLEWLIGLGVRFPAEDLYIGGVETVPRSHKPEGFGAAIVAALDAAATQRSIDVVLKTKCDRLLVDERDRVIGVQAGDDRVHAGAVILATGGFGRNPFLLNKYYPDATKAGRLTWCISADTCQGDGLLLGERAGAAIVGFNRGLLLVSPGFHHHLESKIPPWVVLVNREGRRFVKETAAYAVMSGVVGAQTGGSAFAIFDEAALAAAVPDPAVAEAFDAGTQLLNWVKPVLVQQVEKRTVLKAQTLQELARAAGIDPASLEVTLRDYNADCARGVDSAYLKDGGMRPVGTPPFYATEVRPTIVALTSVGVRIDPDARARNRAGAVIPGLFAAGETTGGVLGERYIGSGNAVANAVTFGCIAGASAARAARENEN